MRASALNCWMRPVSSAYRFWAAVNCVADAPGKFVALNIASAGSPCVTAKVTLGTSVWSFAQSVYCVYDAPIVKLCAPFSHVTLSSNKSAVALRDEGTSVLLGDWSVLPTEGKLNRSPFEFATVPVNCDALNSSKKRTGAQLYPTRASLTRWLVNVERTQLLNPMRSDV